MRDPKTEQYLKNGGYAFVFVPNMSIDTIDLVEAKANPARLSRRLDDERVNNYGIAMLDGVDFPAVVVFADVPKKRLVTGLHRLTAALDAELTTFDAYVVTEKDEYRRVLLTRSINSIEGKAPDQRENLGQALEIRRLFPGITIKDIAAALNLKPEAITAYDHQVKMEERALLLGVSEYLTGLPAYVKLELGRIPSDTTFCGTIRAVGMMKLRGTAVTDFIKTVKATRSENDAHKIINSRVTEWRDDQDRAKARYGRTPTAISTRFMSVVRSVIREPIINKLALSGIPAHKLPSEIQAVEQAIEFLNTVLINLNHRQEQLEEASWQQKSGTADSEHTSPRP